MKRILALLTFILIAFILSAKAAAETSDPRREVPAAFKGSYIGLTGGQMYAPFSNKDLENGFTANSIVNPRFAPSIFIGHYFNPYIAGQLSLMRPIEWVHYYGIENPDDRHSVWISLFGITARPTLPLTRRLTFYGNIGLGLISRHGFDINNQVAVESTVIPTLLTGAGFAYAFDPHWHGDIGFSYAFGNDSEKQPHVAYLYAGFYYLLSRSGKPEEHFCKKHYIFPLNFIQAAFFTDAWFHENVNKYFTEGGILPIFWDGKVKNRNGALIIYERNFFHTDRSFSLEWGASIGRYQSQLKNQTYYTFSLFPELKLWIVRTKYVDFYFTYSIAGPTYITRKYIDGIDTGEHFIFQDLMGIGLFLGQKKNFNINVKIGHYSNGNVFPMNAGIEVPLTVAVGYTFE